MRTSHLGRYITKGGRDGSLRYALQGCGRIWILESVVDVVEVEVEEERVMY